MTDFLSQLKQGLDDGNCDDSSEDVRDLPPHAHSSSHSQDYPVLAEIKIRSTELHKIAQGECKTLADGALGIRFLLKKSFKVNNSRFVVNNFVMQIIALGKDNVMHKEDIAVKTRVQTVTKEKIVKAKKEVKEAPQSKLGEEEVY